MDRLVVWFGPFWWFFVLLFLIYAWVIYRHYLWEKKRNPLSPQERGEYFHLLRHADWGLGLTEKEYARLTELEKRFHGEEA